MHQPTKVTIMKSFFALLGMAALLVIGLAPAHADDFNLYIMPYGGFANTEELDLDNVVYGVEAGLTNDRWDFGGDVMKWSHLGDESTVIQGKVRYAIGPWVIKPTVAVGAGAVVEGFDPVVSIAGGLLWEANDEGEAGSFGIALVYSQLFIFDNLSDIGDFGSWADRTDDQLLLEVKMGF